MLELVEHFFYWHSNIDLLSVLGIIGEDTRDIAIIDEDISAFISGAETA